jgi:hypothetical protein
MELNSIHGNWTNLKLASRTYWYSCNNVQATPMSARVMRSPTKYVRGSRWVLRACKAAFTSSLALSVDYKTTKVTPYKSFLLSTFNHSHFYSKYSHNHPSVSKEFLLFAASILACQTILASYFCIQMPLVNWPVCNTTTPWLVAMTSCI